MEDDNDGRRFRPTEEEKVIYLYCKAIGRSVPAHDFIGECDLYGEKEPWEIFGESEETELYLFTRLKKVGKKKSGCEYKRFSRNVGEGTWSNKGKTVPIYRQRKGGGVIGYKKCFRYQRKIEGGDGIWLMKEYSLPENLDGVKEEYKDCVLCVLKRKGESRHEDSMQNRDEHAALALVDQEYLPDEHAEMTMDQEIAWAETNAQQDQDMAQVLPDQENLPGAWTVTNAQVDQDQEENLLTNDGAHWTDTLFDFKAAEQYLADGMAEQQEAPLLTDKEATMDQVPLSTNFLTTPWSDIICNFDEDAILLNC